MSSISGGRPPAPSVAMPDAPASAHSLGGHATQIRESALRPHFATLSRERDASLALNIHLPFCPSRCLTCDRIAVVQQQADDVTYYVVGLERELAAASDVYKRQH